MIDLQQQSGERQFHMPRKPKHVIIFTAILLTAGIAYMLFHIFLQNAVNSWSKEKLEAVISQDMRRKVELGKVRWSFGLNGIVFHSDRITIKELDGRPFVIAGQSDIAAAFFPMLQYRELRLSHLDFNAPEIWARHISKTKWNFSDLPKLPELESLSHLGVHGGKLHIIDEQKPSLHIEVASIEGKLDRPFYRPGWPFVIKANIKHPTYVTAIEIDGVGHGDPDDWIVNEHSFNGKAQNLNLSDFSEFTGPLPDPGGLINVQFAGSGVPTKHVSAKVGLQTRRFGLAAQRIEILGTLPFLPDKNGQLMAFEKTDLKVTNMQFSMPEAKLFIKSLNANAQVTPDKVVFEKAAGRFGHSEFVADGWIDSKHRADIRYHGKNISLEELKQTIKALKLPAPSVVQQPLFGTIKEAWLTLKGELNSPAITLTAMPDKLYYMPNQPKRLFELEGGKVLFDGKTASFEKLAGRMGRGTFTLDGTSGATSDGKIDVRLASSDVNLTDVKDLLKELKIDSPLVTADALFGEIKSASGEIRGTLRRPSIALKVVPIDLYYMEAGKARTLEIVGGELGIRDRSIDFHDTRGRIGDGKFWLNGTVGPNPAAPVDLKIRGENMDLSNVKLAMKDLKVQSPLLAEQLLYGTVKSVDLTIKGPPKAPIINMVAYPQNLRYEPLGSTRPVHLTSGKVTFADDSLALQDVNVASQRSSLKTSLQIDHLSKVSTISSLTVDTPGFDLSDLHSYLVADRTPPMVRKRYLDELKAYNITTPQGKVHGHLALKAKGKAVSLSGDMSFEDVSIKMSGFPLHNLKGRFVAAGNNFQVEHFTGNLGKSTFTAAGVINNFTDAAAKSWNINISALVDMKSFLSLIGQKEDQARKIITSGPIPVAAQLTGTNNQLTATFNSTVSPEADLSLTGPFGVMSKPKGQSAIVAGTLNLQENKIALQNVRIQSGNSIIRINGAYSSPISANAPPTVDITIDLPNPIQASSMVAFLPADTIDKGLKNLDGTISGSIQLRGPSSAPAVKGSIQVNDFGVPSYKLTHVSGTISSSEWVTGNSTNPDERQSSPFDVNISSMMLNKLPISNIKGKLVAANYTNPTTNVVTRTLRVKDLTADIAKGKLKMLGWTSQEKPIFGGTADITGVDANQLFTELFDAPNEITGTMQAHIRFRAEMSPGKNVYDTLEVPPADANSPTLALRQPSSYKMENGHVTRFSLLQRRITQANLLKGGIIDFNINNFLESVAPVRNGDYKIIQGTFVLKPHLSLEFNDAQFNGDELRMRAGGHVDFSKDKMDVVVFGNIPRTSTRGFFGKIGPMFSISGFASLLHDGLPLLPKVWPENKPRAFQFKILAALDKPEAMNKSIMDSFKWLPNEKDATAHPALAGGSPPS